MRLVRLLGLFVAIVAWLPMDGAAADPYPVTSTADDTGTGTLRWAIGKANEHGGADTIPIDAAGSIGLQERLPPIIDDVTITGPGADSLTVERTASTSFRIFELVHAAGTVSDLTVSGGKDLSGAGFLNESGDLTLVRVAVTGNEVLNEGGSDVATLAAGGGIFSNGSLILRESSVSGNLTFVVSGESIAAGGGVKSEGTLLVERSTISDNFADARSDAAGEIEASAEAFGGGVAIAPGTSTTVVESTISDNFVLAKATDLAIARGGGIQGGPVSLTGSTIAENGAELDAAGALIRNVAGDNLAVASGSLIRNSIVSNPKGEGENCANSLLSGSFNLDEDGSCEFGQATDLAGVVAGLEPLAMNGGPTPTHALRADSPALDRGSAFGSPIDQRGLPRPSDFAAISDSEGGDGSDIGAFELQAPPAAGGGPVLVSAVPTDTAPPNTRIVSGPPRVTFKREAKFRFASTEAQPSFQCKLDQKQWRGCRNPYKRSVKAGKHLFKVRAIDRFGNVDPTPARFGWRVKPLNG